MESFNRANLKELRRQLDDVLSKLGREHNITISCGNMRFTENNCSATIKMNAKGSKSKEDLEKSNFEMCAHAYGLQPSDFGRSFVLKGSVYTISGIVPTRHKYPINAKRQDGKEFKFPTLAIQTLLPKTTTQ